MNKKGFTLVELLAVIAILAILVIIALPNVLSMFNSAKKDIFLTEAKNLYKEVSKKYISETMKGNKINKISNDNNKLDMESNNLEYNIKLDDKGNIKKFQVSDGTYCLSGSFNNLGELTSDKITDGKCVSSDETIETKTFSEDSWKTISKAIKEGNTDKYNVGDTKEIDLETYGKHTLRIANKSTPSECNSSSFSQTACGFVIEFADIIMTRNMNDTPTSQGGWPATSMRTFINNEIYNSLPTELKSSIIDTIVISGYAGSDKNNFTSTDKLYLLSTAELWAQGTSSTISDDTARNVTRQLDYYKNLGVTTNNYSAAIKKNGTNASYWWLRSAYLDFNSNFYGVGDNGSSGSNAASITSNGVSPAFRIG